MYEVQDENFKGEESEDERLLILELAHTRIPLRNRKNPGRKEWGAFHD
jgi:hypothetical protein